MFSKSKLKSQLFLNQVRIKYTHLFWIVSGTIIFVILIIFTSVKIYNIALDETKRNHQLLQKDMADATAAGINYYLENLSNDLQLLVKFRRLQKFERDLLRDPMDDLFNYAKDFGVKTIFATDIETNLIYSTTDTIPRWVGPLLQQKIQWASNIKNRRTSWFSSVSPSDVKKNNHELCFLILVPLYRYPHDPLESNLEIVPVGFVGEVVNFNWLIQKFVASINLGNTGSAWIMDSQGRLLFHPEHPEMILRDISEKSADCISCHPSFEKQKEMITTEAAYGEYTVGEEPKKIMSHVPLQIQNERWILVISSNLSDVASALRSKSFIFFVMVSLILLLTILISIYLYRINIKIIQAREAQRYSERKELLHLQVCQASKLASVGELVDSVAHEMNTPISIILAQAEALRLKITDEKNVFEEEIEIIKKQSQRVKYYTQKLLNYSKGMPFEPKKISVSKLFDECLFLLAPRFRVQKINIIKNYNSPSVQIIADRNQIEQVFINLLNNAIDAIGSQGEIKIEIFQTMKNAINGVEIKISDDGEGIATENLSNIFKSFYTTKLPSRGTGLGLSISKAIILRHRGEISVESTPGKGTTFNIILPLNLKEA